MDSIKRLLAVNSAAGAPTRKKKLLFVGLLSTLLLAAAIIGIAATVHKDDSGGPESLKTPQSHAIIRTACSSTLYPELCFSAVAASPKAANRITSQKDVIEESLNLTTTAVQHNFLEVEKLIAGRGRTLTGRERTALYDCLEMIDETLDDLHKAVDDLHKYPTKKSLQQHADDLKTLMSAAMTNQETCLDGFSHDKADKHVRAALLAGQVHVEKMCSNALAMIKNMTDTDMEIERRTMSYRRLREEERPVAEAGWPVWLSAGDRRLLQSTNATADVVVAADGSGDYKTVSEAVEAAPVKSSKRFVIRIMAGVYHENVEVTKKKTNLMFIGEGREKTIITGDRSVRGGTTTFKSATVAVVGEGFLARDITFENKAGHEMHQAVALRVGADLSAFYQCDILAHQDTLYVHSNRQFFIKCLIAGTVDFIFGNAAVVFQDCDIHARRPGPGQKNMMTAHGRTDPNQVTGIVIQNCRIGATSDLEAVKGDFPTYLGRPWKEHSRTVIMQSAISDVIHPAGWHEWNGGFALSTLFYGEYLNTGAGAGTSKRVSWKGFSIISETEAQGFTAGRFIAGGSWLGSTGFPFSLGLEV